MSIVFLIGMPGCGKTYWGSKLAAAYDCKFIDLDQYIERKQLKTIPVIFEQSGEDFFRVVERNALDEIIAGNGGSTIVACGGGTPAFFDNMNRMNGAGCTVYLQTEIPTLVQRLENDNYRPLVVKDKNVLPTSLELLLAKRDVYYKQSKFTLQVENLSLANFAEIIEPCINQQS